MKPVAQALNILQGETNHSNAYMGYLATITMLRDKLSKKLDIPVTKPLVQELLNAIDKRFDSILNDKKIIAAAFFTPNLKKAGLLIVMLLKEVTNTILIHFIFKL
jgi:hypothetical protein